MSSITLCRYEDGLIKKVDFKLPLDAVSFIAISHIWADATWQHGAPGIDEMVLASKQKIQFLAEQLPELVGAHYFWMDILCVDQSSPQSKIDVIKHIPMIYRTALKTIVVRERGGFQKCCADAVGLNFGAWMQGAAQTFANHMNSAKANHDENFVEIWFNRLWPLQEAVLSDRLHFTVCNSAGPIQKEEYDVAYASHIGARRMVDSLYCVAQAWSMYGLDVPSDESERTAFIVAFLNNGEVTRKITNRHRPRAIQNDFRIHINSMRITSKPRDFILAIMPQYGWYTPPESARNMSFGQLWVDCHNQALAAGYGFISMFTKGMTTSSVTPHDSKLPSDDIPAPACLGDFIKLFGRTKQLANESGGLVGPVTLRIPATDDMEAALQIIQGSMQLCPFTWYLAHRGDISQYGIMAEAEPSDLRTWRSFSRVMEGAREELSNKAHLEELLRKGKIEQEDPKFYKREAMKSLNAMWTGLFEPDPGARDDWRFYRRELLQINPPHYQGAMLQLAALISCGLGASMLEWSEAKLIPVVARLREQQVLALLFRPSTESAIPIEGKEFYCVQRNARSGINGCNLVLVDGEDGSIVGKLPDIVSGAETQKMGNSIFEKFYSVMMLLNRDWTSFSQPRVGFVHKPNPSEESDVDQGVHEFKAWEG